jgi:hypothetical protein
MKKLLAFILLLSHLNTSMFIPQTEEQDISFKNGFQRDDINSVVEYIEVALGKDKTSDDEDDDQGQVFHIVKLTHSIYEPVFNEIETEVPSPEKVQQYPPYQVPAFTSLVTDIQTPPPDFIAA